MSLFWIIQNFDIFQVPEVYQWAMLPNVKSSGISSSARASGGIWRIFIQNRRCLWITIISVTWRTLKCAIVWIRWGAELEKTLDSATVMDLVEIRCEILTTNFFSVRFLRFFFIYISLRCILGFRLHETATNNVGRYVPRCRQPSGSR